MSIELKNNSIESEAKYRLHLAQGLQFFKQNELSKAREQFVKAQLAKPNSYVLHYNIANTYLAEQNIDMAMPSLLKSCESHNPKYLKTLISVQFNLREFSQLKSTIHRFMPALKEHPLDSSFLLNLIESIAIEKYQENNQECIEWCLLGLELFLNHRVFWELMIHSHIRNGQYNKALELYNNCTLALQTSAELDYLCGTALFFLGQFEKAKFHFKTSHDSDKNHQISPDYYIRNCLSLGDSKIAESLLATYLDHFPASPSYYAMISNFHALLGDLPKVRQHAINGINFIVETKSYVSPPPQNQFLEANAFTAINECKTLLDDQGLTFFLVCGTLLGVVREGNLLKHDKDLDIGIFEDTNIEALVRTLTKDNVFKRVIVVPDCDPPIFLSFIHSNTNITIDIFIYRNLNSKLISGIPKLPHPIASLYSKFDLSKIEWKGQLWNIPKNPENYLCELYGKNWQIPDPLFDTVISSQIKTNESIAARLAYGYCKLLEHIHLKKHTKALSLISQIQNLEYDEDLERIKTTISNITISN